MTLAWRCSTITPMTKTRAALHLARELPNGTADEHRVSAEVQSVDQTVYRADGAQSTGSPQFTAFASSETAALLAMLAQLFGAEQDLRDALEDQEREAWAQKGRISFRAELCAMFDELDSHHAHDLSQSADGCDDAAIDLLWRVGCVALHVVYEGCSISPHTRQRFFHVSEWVSSARSAFRGVPLPYTFAAYDLGEHLRHLAQRTRKLSPIHHDPVRSPHKDRTS
jgi:hypothetical protein